VAYGRCREARTGVAYRLVPRHARCIGRRAVSLVDRFVAYLRSCYAPAPVSLVCADSSPASIAGVLDHARAAVVSGARDVDDLLARAGLQATFRGWSPDGERLAVLERRQPKAPRAAPASFRVAAIVPTFNEADVIAHTLQYLVDDGIGVYVIDNWSTDGTLELVRHFEGRGLLGVERFPRAGAPSTYDLRAILGRVEELALLLQDDWIVLHDADERRRGPWPDVGLRDSLYHVDRAGFTCVDHVTLNFWATDNGYDGTQDVERYFSCFEFSDHPGHFQQRRAWKNLGEGVSLAPTAGHDVSFYGRHVYPFKFLLKHYPVRSQRHGERKVLQQRISRWNAEERALGWHAQYDHMDTFVRAAAELIQFDPRTFYERYLLERLSSVGVFERPPAWATPPTWTAD
jgi:glycosyltransferase involved in cell wall biosynthesis